MADNRGRGRGRGEAKGRGQSQSQQQQSRQQQPRQQQPQQQQQQPRQQQQQQPQQQQPRPAWQQKQQQPQQQQPQKQQQQPQKPAERGSGDAKSSPRDADLSKQVAQLSIGPSGDAGRKKFEKPEILRTRPDHIKIKTGTYGALVKLETNYFKFNTTTNWALHQYRVDFSPEEDRTFVKRRLFNRILDSPFIPNIFDGSVLTTINEIKNPLEYTVTHTEDESKIVHIKIRHVASLLNKADYGYIQLFNLLSRRALENLKLQLIGRNYFDPKQTIVIPQYQLEVWPGYLTSIRQHENSTLMCAEIVGKVMRQQTVYDILAECRQRNSRDFQRDFKNEVIGTVVLTTYTDRTYRVDDIDFNVNPGHSFEKNGERITYAQYLEQRYQIKNINMTQPMLVSKANARQRRSGMPELIYLVPQLCRTTGLTDQMRNNFQLMKEVAKYTCSEPSVRIQKLLSFNQRISQNEKTSDQWKQWGLSLGRELVPVNGRQMPPEEVHFGGGAVERTDDWTRALQSMKPIVSQGVLNNWFILHPKYSKSIPTLLDLMLKASKGMKFTIGKPQCVPLENDNPVTYVNMIENIMSKTTPQMIFCVVSSAAANRYSAIKQKCCVDRPVPSQVIKEATINRRNALSIMTNVVIQMNCKIGGVPWRVPLPSNDVMVIGFDVCHDTSKSGYDYGATIASINPDCTRYYSAVSEHKKGEEICDTLADQINKALNSYLKMNGKLPHRIFMFRDGVGEGQLNQVTKVEVNRIQGMLKRVYAENNMPLAALTYVIVTKRINSRFFLQKNNPNPGTIVDDVITDPDKYDFFLVSAKANVGTITPTYYNVILDENKLRPEMLQRFTFKLTHLYYNTSKTVRVPAPCHYAHKLAFLVSQFIHQTPSESLAELLYFL
ncbi:piwi-like protein Siwi isoform X2 [Leptopilina boulardi]|uniref:piwi-like protein Siwi isoform X2 n=1 Tax=Leptopilina boulardi TaxID=63433 RepID=UPI0021F62E2A|nr:piwi-like protein Siwi isoform X2 [Leptopilina boulardi]